MRISDWSSDVCSSDLEEPTVLPSRIPTLLVNGASGIAVGMATNMPPHNLTEVVDATIAYIDNRDITIDELMQYVKARSEERRVGKECVRPFRSRWSADH